MVSIVAKQGNSKGRAATCTVIAWLLLSGCAPLPVQTASGPPAMAQPPAAVSASAQIALPAMVMTERNAAHRGDLAMLAALWSSDAIIIDSRNTASLHDDYVWRGRGAILDRYIVAVLPAPPPELGSAPTFAVSVEDSIATAQNGVDQWRAAFHGGRWWLEELVIEPAP